MNKKKKHLHKKRISYLPHIVFLSKRGHKTSAPTNESNHRPKETSALCHDAQDIRASLLPTQLQIQIQNLLFFEQTCYRLQEQISRKTKEMEAEFFLKSKHFNRTNDRTCSTSIGTELSKEVSQNTIDEKKNPNKPLNLEPRADKQTTAPPYLPFFSTQQTIWALHLFYLGLLSFTVAYIHQTKDSTPTQNFQATAHNSALSIPTNPAQKRRSTPQRSTPQRSTPQRSTPQRSTPQRTQTAAHHQNTKTSTNPSACPPPPRCLFPSPEKRDAPMTSLAFIPDPRGLVYEKDETKDLFQKIDFSSRKANPR